MRCWRFRWKEQDAQPRRIAFADAGALVGTDSALYRDGKLLVAQTMSADGKAFMRIAQLDLQSTAIEVLTEPVVDSVVSVTNNVLAYCEMWEGGFAVCLRSLKDGGIAQCAQSDAPVDVIATQSGFALDDGQSPRTVTWVDAAGKTLGSAALDGQLKPCSGALNDNLYYVNTANLRTVVVLSPNKSA